MSESIQQTLPYVALCGSRKIPVKKLSGFSKAAGHREPEEAGPQTDAFLQNIGAAEVQQQAEQLHRALRVHLGYKRRELNYEATEGAVRLLTPDCQVVIWIEGAPDDLSIALLQWEINRFKDIAFLQSRDFISALDGSCRQLRIRFPKPVIVEDIIDRLEENPAGSAGLDYPPDASRFVYKPSGSQLAIAMDANQLSITATEEVPLQELLHKSLEWIGSLLKG